MLYAAIVFMPIVIFLIMNRIFGKMLLQDGERNKMITFFGLCVILYFVIIYLVAQVNFN